MFSILYRLEGHPVFSETYRKIAWHYHNVKIGKYSYISDLMLDGFPPGTIIGCYCSLGPGLKIFRRNHPINRLSLHPFFYNKVFGIVKKDTIINIEENPLSIGNDVWIGANVIICPGCKNIGNGAVIAAGSVVTKDVPPFSIIGSNPAVKIRKRFDPEIIDKIISVEWWFYSIEELKNYID